MALTLATFAALRIAVPLWVRPNLAPAGHMVIPMTGPGGSTFTLTTQGVPGQPGAWPLSSGPVNTAGQPVSNTPAACIAVSTESDPSAFPDCLASHGIREGVTDHAGPNICRLIIWPGASDSRDARPRWRRAWP
jgi:hypothetical protein